VSAVQRFLTYFNPRLTHSFGRIAVIQASYVRLGGLVLELRLTLLGSKVAAAAREFSFREHDLTVVRSVKIYIPTT